MHYEPKTKLGRVINEIDLRLDLHERVTAGRDEAGGHLRAAGPRVGLVKDREVPGRERPVDGHAFHPHLAAERPPRQLGRVRSERRCVDHLDER